MIYGSLLINLNVESIYSCDLLQTNSKKSQSLNNLIYIWS